jgi:hypothetical protein
MNVHSTLQEFSLLQVIDYDHTQWKDYGRGQALWSFRAKSGVLQVAADDRSIDLLVSENRGIRPDRLFRIVIPQMGASVEKYFLGVRSLVSIPGSHLYGFEVVRPHPSGRLQARYPASENKVQKWIRGYFGG